MCLVTARSQSVAPWSTSSEARRDKAFTEFFRQTNGWAAGDVATSIPLSDGRVLWLFGDSYVDQFDAKTGTLPCLFDARNAVLVQSTNDPWHPRTLLNSNSGDKSFFHPPNVSTGAPPVWFWPAAGFQEDDVIYIQLAELQSTPQGGMWGFKTVGQYWAKLSFPELRNAGYAKLPSFNGISFGCGFAKDEKLGFIYAFGQKQRGMESDVFVARFSANNPEGPWVFWTGKTWDANVAKAARITQGTSTSVSVCKAGGTFLLLTTQFSVACDQGRAIYISVADSPVGPFSPRTKIFTVDDAVQGHHPFFYLAEAHPEFIKDNELLITYCINGYLPCVPNCVNGRMNPDYYRPRALHLLLK
jgi:hypothetical protein